MRTARRNGNRTITVKKLALTDIRILNKMKQITFIIISKRFILKLNNPFLF